MKFQSVLDEVEAELDSQVVFPNIDGYRILGELETGGMGAVYLAERVSEELNLSVAIKVLRREFNTRTVRQKFN